MNILFYQLSEKGNLISANVHITEVFRNLSKIGHSVVFADGHSFKVDTGKNTPNIVPGKKSLIKKILRYILYRSIIRGEVLILYTLLNEIKLFITALMTVLHSKPDVIYARHGTLTIFGSEYILSKIFGIPVVIEVNGIAIDEVKMLKNGGPLSLKIINTFERLKIPRSEKFIVVTSKLKDVLHDDYKIPGDKIIVIENGANTDLFKAMDTAAIKKELSLLVDTKYICFAGVFYRWQGIENLISALPYVLKEIPDTRVLLVGDGEMKDELLELARQLEITDKIIFPGKVPYEQVPMYINASEICVVPKRPLRSGYSPLKLCEYMACGKPVIATKTEGFEVLEDYRAGLLVNPENHQELAAAIINLLRDPALRQLMGENGRKYVVENRSWESVALKVAAVCQQTVDEYKKKHNNN